MKIYIIWEDQSECFRPDEMKDIFTTKEKAQIRVTELEKEDCEDLCGAVYVSPYTVIETEID